MQFWIWAVTSSMASVSKPVLSARESLLTGR
jgi:hypothetical protein